MEIIIKETMNDAGILGAKIVARIIREIDRPVLGLATGNSQLPLYKELVRMGKEGLSFKHVRTFNLDEFVGISPTHPASFFSFMNENLFGQIDIIKSNTAIPNGQAANIPKECDEYERKILEAGGIDIQVLGIGEDGHLGFNEPTSSLSSRTRIKTLHHITKAANSNAFGGIENVPNHVLTMGLGTIMNTRCCLLLAFGEKKAKAVQDMVEGPLSAGCPASVLQLHERSIIILDREAASLLERREYYDEVYKGKPDWQKWEQ